MVFDLGAGVQGFATLRQAAAEGSFAINENGGKALLEAIRQMKDWVDEKRFDLQRLADQPPLGGSHGADAIRQLVPQVATDGQGFLTMLMKFRESLDEASAGIRTAMANYQAMDERGVSRQST